jgi:ABC-type uncharacterized transport system permease subunit
VTRRKSFGGVLAGFTGLALTIAISFALVVGLILLLSKVPAKTIYSFFVGPFTNAYYLGNMLNVTVPLIFTGLGISIAFKSSVFNLGGEGQTYAGGLAATVVCLALPAANGYLGGILALLAAVALSGAIAGLSGFFRMRWEADEMISSFLLSSAVVLVVNYFIQGPLDDPNNNLLATLSIGQQYKLLKIFPPSKLNVSVAFALVAAVGVYFFMFKSHAGYEMRMCGLNREFSRYGGINVSTYLVLPMVLSGALHGLGGALMVLGTYQATIQGFSFGMGWNGIAVALIAKNNPLGVIPAALLFAYLDAGAKAAMLHGDVTFEIASIAQSFIFYLVTAQALYAFARKRRMSGNSQFAIPMIHNAVAIMTPFLLAGIGGLFTELAGMLNIALEGLILTGAFFSIVFASATGNLLLGILLGILCSMLLSLLFGLITLYLRANVFITGLATNLFASGFTIVLAFQLFKTKGVIQFPNVPRLPELVVPEALQRIPVLGDILFGHNIIVYATWLIVIVSAIVIYRTPYGMRLRGTGLSEPAIVSLGLDPKRYQLSGILVSGFTCGLAGAMLTLQLAAFVPNISSGRGWIALVAIYLGNRSPLGIVIASFVFGMAESFSNYAQGAIKVPVDFILALPYVITVVAMIVYSIFRHARTSR